MGLTMSWWAHEPKANRMESTGSESADPSKSNVGKASARWILDVMAFGFFKIKPEPTDTR
jgi:hypothetical protein